MIFFSVLLLLTVPLYFGAILTTATLATSDGSQGLSRSFAYILTSALWTSLAAIMATAYLQIGISTASAIAALLLVPLTGIAALQSIRMRKASCDDSTRLLLIGWVAPLLIVAFASWTYFPSFREVAPEWAIDVVVWPSLLMLASLPWWRHARSTAAFSQNKIADAGSRNAPLDQQPVAGNYRRAAFLALGPHVSLRKWLPYITRGNELRDEALAAIRQSPRRQADAESLLKSGATSLWQDVPEFDLKLTPTLADLGRKFVRERALDITPLHLAEAPNFEYMASRIQPYFDAIKWLVEQHCDCRAELLSVIDAVKLYPESMKRNAFLGELIALRPPAVIARTPASGAHVSERIASSS